MSALEHEPALQESPQPLGDPGRALIGLWNERRRLGLNERRKYEPTWAILESFLSGRQWVVWSSPNSGRIGRVISEPNPQRRERHTVNVITNYVQTMLGKLFVEDLRPTIVFTRPDAESESISEHTRAAARFLWSSELDADARLYDVILSMLTYGSSAMWCYFDPQRGEELGQVPVGPDGQPILDPQQAQPYVAQAFQQGLQIPFVTLREGRVVWEPLSPRSIIIPPGIPREENFPWLIIERAIPLEWVEERYPQATGRLSEEQLTTYESTGLWPENYDSSLSSAPIDAGRLRKHALVSIGFELPNKQHPRGRVIHWNASQNVILEIKEELPYALRGNPHHGIVFAHYSRLPHRFWGRGVIEDLVGPQRQKNRARSQMIELKDRNLGRVYARKGTITAANKPVGKIMELIEIPLHSDYPQETTGGGIGPWVENEARINDEEMQLVAGLRDVSFGSTPSGVVAYSALALLAEQDERRIGPVLKRLRASIGDAMVLSLELARRYWQDGKEMAIAGPDGEMELTMFRRAQLPLEFYVDVSRHSPLPTSPAVESQKIFDLFNAATSAGQPLPVDWLKSSLDAGRALPIPKALEEVQIGKAEIENVLISQGQPVYPAYYDDDYLHILIHRKMQTEIIASPQLSMLLEAHIQMHAQNAQMKRPSQMGGNVPTAQGGHGIEAQNADVTSQQGLAQQQAGDAPLQ